MPPNTQDALGVDGMNRWESRLTRSSARAQRGFTLIELMITVAIITILAAVAYPSYTAYIQRGRIADMTALLATTRVRLEQFYQDNRNYGSTATVCGVALPTAAQFTFSCNWGTGATDQSFLLTATGSAAMAGFEFTIDHANQQRTTAFPGDSGLPVNCWRQRKGQAC
jgi:type IV pilus assembly protein PilE